MRTTVAALAGLLLLPIAASAQEAAPPAPPAPAPEAAPAPPAPPVPAAAPAAAPAAPSAIVLSGLVDTYYMRNLTAKSSMVGPYGRSYDTLSNNFTLNYLKLGAAYSAGPVSFRADVGFGQMASVILGGTSAGTTTQPLVLVQQAFATLTLLDGKLAIDAGRFVTTAGSEVIEANANWLYSRSLLFTGITLLHQGVRATYTVSPMLALQASIVNSLSPVDPDNNAPKSFGLNAVLKPMDTTLIAATLYAGNEPAGAAGNKFALLFDLVANHQLNQSVALNLNVDYAKQDTANWFGIAAMGKFTLSDALYLAARAEFVKSKNYFLALDGSVYEVTAMAGLPFGKNLEIRVEVRTDMSDKEVISNGEANKKNQFTGLVSFLAFTN